MHALLIDALFPCARTHAGGDAYFVPDTALKPMRCRAALADRLCIPPNRIIAWRISRAAAAQALSRAGVRVHLLPQMNTPRRV